MIRPSIFNSKISNNSSEPHLFSSSLVSRQQELANKQAAELSNLNQTDANINSYGFCLNPANLHPNQQISSTHLINSQASNLIGNQTNNQSTNKWVTILINYLEDNDESNYFNADILINEFENISRESALSMQEKLKRQLSTPTMYKSNSRKLKYLRLQCILKFLDKINYAKKPSNIFLKDKSSKDLIEDIHTIATCYTENAIKASIFDLFLINAKDSDEHSEGVSLDQTMKSFIINTKHITERIQLENNIEFEKLNERFNIFETCIKSLIKENDELKTQNELILSKFDTILNNDEEDALEGKRKQAKLARSISPLHQNEPPINFEPNLVCNAFKNLSSNVTVNNNDTSSPPAAENNTIFSYSAVVSSANMSVQHQNKSNQQQKKPVQNKSVLQQNENWKKVEPAKHKPTINVKKITENGITRLINNNNHTNNNHPNGSSKSKTKNLIIGTAISNCKILKAVSKPFYYYTGQWSNKTEASSLRDYISNFAKVINIEELSTHIQNRKHKSFKLVVESYCHNAITDPTNWPGGVQVTRWRGPTKRPKNYNSSSEQVLVTGTNQKQPEYVINNSNQHIINNQMIETVQNKTSREAFKKSLEAQSKQNALKQSNPLSSENLDEIIDNEENNRSISIINQNDGQETTMDVCEFNTQKLSELVQTVHNQNHNKSSVNEATSEK